MESLSLFFLWTSPIPQTSFLPWTFFAASYCKTALEFYNGAYGLTKAKFILLDTRGSSKLAILASQLTKPPKMKRLFSFGLVPENLTRGSQRYRFKARKY
jgi:hypothetical protein